MMGFMQTSEVLSLYDATDVIASFEKHCKPYEFDAQIGEAQALRAVASLKGKPEARLLIRACCVIAAADGNFDVNERDAIARMCNELDLQASDFLPAK
jgi:tellurite resistance protein TerB